jgi:hypothetical protein
MTINNTYVLFHTASQNEVASKLPANSGPLILDNVSFFRSSSNQERLKSAIESLPGQKFLVQVQEENLNHLDAWLAQDERRAVTSGSDTNEFGG